MNVMFNENTKRISFITVCHLQSNCNFVELCKIICEQNCLIVFIDTLKDSNEISSYVMEMTLEMILTELSMCVASVCFEHCEWSVKKCDLRKGVVKSGFAVVE